MGQLLQIPRPYLYAGILFFASLGAYTVNFQWLDLMLLLLFGLLGLAMRRFGLPVLPLIIGVILGPLVEARLREALLLSDGQISGLFSEPAAVVTYLVIAALLTVPLFLRPTASVQQPEKQVDYSKGGS